MTNPTIERVARAIADNIGPPFDKLHKDKRHWLQERGMFEGEHRDVNGPFQGDCIEAAKAALSALLEPDEAMVETAAREYEDVRIDEVSAAWVFTAMIKAAMGES